MNARTFVLATLAVLVPATAAAQPMLQAPAPLEPAPPAPTDGKSPAMAVALSLGVTGAGFAALAMTDDMNNSDASSALAVAGVTLIVGGPSAGHIYAGESHHALATTALRAAGLGVGAVAAVSMIDFCWDECPEEDHTGAGIALALGLGVYAGATLYDFIDAAGAARRANRRASSVRLAPTALASQRGIVPGMVLGGSF